MGRKFFWTVNIIRMDEFYSILDAILQTELFK